MRKSPAGVLLEPYSVVGLAGFVVDFPVGHALVVAPRDGSRRDVVSERPKLPPDRIDIEWVCIKRDVQPACVAAHDRHRIVRMPLMALVQAARREVVDA
jgi:hypothetical protein